ncbi:hypothetical protein [Sphingobacterium sp. LRF_L2]|uniref:hypothetical protein n=1 Tax=Sphingobacterium sp. LRF_L2 TaxID=3369421 RepID=UPI003F5F7321
MKGIIVVSKFWTAFFSGKNAVAVTIFPFIFVIDERLSKDEKLINHENIHIRQAIELGVILFYVWYLFEFLIHFLRCWDFKRAYLQISFEKEAYRHQEDLFYLDHRKYAAFLNYI